jgi:hypothetical protein
MKSKLCIFVLVLSVGAFAQRGGGGGGSHGGGGGMGAGAGGGMGASSTTHGNAGGTHGTTSGAQSGDHSRQTMDAKLSQNSKLTSKLESLLPSGMTAKDACSGFKNLGQCVAAVHVSKNLNIPFADLKAKVTGDSAESLGKAIHEIKPDANAKAEAKKANAQAKHDESQS